MSKKLGQKTNLPKEITMLFNRQLNYLTKHSSKCFWIITFSCFCVLEGNSQIMYRTRYRRAIYGETFAISPLLSINYEYLPIRWQKSFLSTRAGIGFMPGGKSTSSTGVVSNAVVSNGGISFPVSVTYNMLMNNLRKGINRRVSNRCNSLPPKISSEIFLEGGVGHSLAMYKIGNRSFTFAILGLREQIVFDIPPKPRILFIRANFTPAYSVGKVDIETGGISNLKAKYTFGNIEMRGGVSLGVSF